MKITLLFSLISFVSLSLHSQVVIDAPGNVMDYIDSPALSNSAMDIDSITFIGAEGVIGIFNNVDSSFPLDFGVVIGSGAVIGAISAFSTSSGSLDCEGNDELYDVAFDSFGITDCASMEIAFTAISNNLDISFVFASSEYAAFVCSNFSDPMGIFLRKNQEGESYENIAFVPGTEIPVSVNSLNGGFPIGAANTIFCDEANPDWEETAIYYLESENGEYGLQTSGLTLELIAEAELEIGEPYLLKLAIGDAVDVAFDSYLFVNFDGSPAFDCPSAENNIGDTCSVNNEFTYFVVEDCSCQPTYNGVDLSSSTTISNPYNPGDTIRLSTRIFNLGLAESNEFTLRYYYSEDTSFDLAEDLLFHSVQLPAIAYGDTSTYTYDYTDYPLPLNDATDRIYVRALSSQDVNTGNNLRWVNLIFEENLAPLVSPNNGYEVVDVTGTGLSFPFGFYIFNLGYETLPNSDVFFYWSEDEILDEDDLLVYEYLGDALAPGDTTEVEITIDVPQPVSLATYYLILSPQDVTRSISLLGDKVVPVNFLSLSADERSLLGWESWMGAEAGLNIKAGTGASGATGIRLFDALGKPIFEQSREIREGEIARFPLPNLPTGIYILQLENSGKHEALKIVLMR